MMMKTLKPQILLLGIALLLAGMACRAAVPGEPAVVLPETAPVQAPAVNAPVNLPPALTNEEQVLMDLYTRVNPSVVSIVIYQRQGDVIEPMGQGSGFVYDDQGHIVTNAHVVHGADEVEVDFSDGLVRKATIVGEDLHSDLAVVKVDAMPAGIPFLPLGNMEEVAVGQTVVAIGNPFGLGGTLTRGIVSAMGRTIPALTPFSIPQSIQTDAPINPGNSGGPLLNLKGEVIGVNAQIETDNGSRTNSGIGFAIPVSIIRVVVPDLVQEGKHTWAWLGVRGGGLTPDLVQAMNLPVERGAYIAEVIAGGPSDKANLRGASSEGTVDGRSVAVGGDVIVAVDGQAVETFEDILIYIALNTRPGQQITLTILRDGQYLEVPVMMEARPDSLE